MKIESIERVKMEQDSSIKKAAKASIGYTVGNILIKGINFISLPIFVRVMTTEEFGVYNVFLSYDAILFVIIGFAMHSCIRNANQDFKGRINEFVSSITLLYIFNLLSLCIISILFGAYLTNLLGVGQYVLIMLVCFSFGSAVIALYNNYLALEYSYKKYLIVAATNSIGNILISFLLMFTFFRSDKAYGRIVGVTIVAFIVGVFIILYFL